MIDTVSALNSGVMSAAESGSKPTTNELGKDSFLQLLVAQMANQDPLEPMDNSQFLAQLAQFSSLEQMQNIAQGMQLLALTQTASTNSQMVNLIGKRVMAEGTTLSLNGTDPVTLRYDLSEAPPGPLSIVVRDSAGKVVHTAELKDVAVGRNQYTFDGKDAGGAMLPAGNYTYAIAATGSTALNGLTTYSSLRIDSVAFKGSTILLKSGDLTVNLSDILEVSEK